MAEGGGQMMVIELQIKLEDLRSNWVISIRSRYKFDKNALY